MSSAPSTAGGALVDLAHGLGRPLVAWLQASTTAIWSDAGHEHVTEHTPLPRPGLPQTTGTPLRCSSSSA